MASAWTASAAVHRKIATSRSCMLGLISLFFLNRIGLPWPGGAGDGDRVVIGPVHGLLEDSGLPPQGAARRSGIGAAGGPLRAVRADLAPFAVACSDPTQSWKDTSVRFTPLDEAGDT